MKLIFIFTFWFVIGFAVTLPITNDDEVLVITKEFYPDELIKYKSHHDIVNILVPINNLVDDSSESMEEYINVPFFFVEADVDAQGKRTDQGLYIFKDNKEKKLLDNGRDAATNQYANPTEVFFGAQDGIYVYKEETGEAVKYGSVSDSIIGIATPNLDDAIYILTEENELFNVTDSGNKKTKINEVVGAQQIVLDNSNNVYFYGQDLQPYVLKPDGLKKIEGLPTKPTSVNLIKPPFIMDDGVPIVMDNTVYFIFQNGTSEAMGIEFKPKAKPTAYTMEAVILQYYAYNKKIYEYNLLSLVEGILSSDEFKNAIEKNNSNIQSLADQTKQKKTNKTKHT